MARRGHFGTRDISRRIVPPPASPTRNAGLVSPPPPPSIPMGSIDEWANKLNVWASGWVNKERKNEKRERERERKEERIAGFPFHGITGIFFSSRSSSILSLSPLSLPHYFAFSWKREAFIKAGRCNILWIPVERHTASDIRGPSGQQRTGNFFNYGIWYLVPIRIPYDRIAMILAKNIGDRIEDNRTTNWWIFLVQRSIEMMEINGVRIKKER